MTVLFIGIYYKIDIELVYLKSATATSYQLFVTSLAFCRDME